MKEPRENMDALPLWRVWLLPLIVFGLVFAVYALSRAGVMTGLDEIMDWAGRLAGTPWAVPALVGLFCVGAFLGLPQFALMGVGVALFGPWLGMAYAWLATMCSGSLTFWTGRLGGEALFARFAGARAQKVSDFLGRNAFKASALVRLIPSGPFIVVNMAFGVSKARFTGFLAGLGLGALPKLGLVALAGQGVIAAEQGALWLAVSAISGVAIIWGSMVWVGRRNHKA